MHPAIAFLDFQSAKQISEGTKIIPGCYVRPRTRGDGPTWPSPVRYGLLMSTILAIVVVQALTTTALATTAPAKKISPLTR